jgi:ATP-binding cassette subfamily B (MDR/TAP) protein 1
MKDLGATKQILGIEVYRDGKNGKLRLSLMRFSMNFVKPINIPLAFHCKLSSSLCPSNKEERIICFMYLMQMH